MVIEKFDEQNQDEDWQNEVAKELNQALEYGESHKEIQHLLKSLVRRIAEFESIAIVKIGNAVLNNEYWDCECDINYIHSKAVGNYCPLCDSYEDEQPDSIHDEVVNMYKKDCDNAIKQI